MKNIYLYQLNKDLRTILTLFLLTLSIGVVVGIGYLYQTTSFNKETAAERFGNSSVVVEEDFGIVESSSKSTSEMLMTTHNHIISFSFIFFFTGAIFYFNSIVIGNWKLFLIAEPFISTLLSFGSMWLVRYWGEGFIYITITSAVIMYLSFFVMIAISIYELNLKQLA